MSSQGAQFQAKRVALAAVTGGAAAAAVNVVVYFLSTVTGIDFLIRPDPSGPPAPITIPSVVVASLVPALIAGGLLLLLGRFTAKARRVFVIIASTFALLSLGGPATVGGASAGTRVALMVMHLLGAAVISGALLRQTRHE